MLNSLPQRECLVCDHKERRLIDQALERKKDAPIQEKRKLWRQLMVIFRLKISMFRDHQLHCMPLARARGQEIVLMDPKEILIDTVGRIDLVLDKCNTMLDRLNKADAVTAGNTAANFVLSLEKLFDLRARIKKELTPESIQASNGPNIQVAMMLPTLPQAKAPRVIQAAAQDDDVIDASE